MASELLFSICFFNCLFRKLHEFLSLIIFKTDSLEEEVTRTLKILVIGDVATGKTCLIQRYTKNTFSNNYKFTVN